MLYRSSAPDPFGNPIIVVESEPPPVPTLADVLAELQRQRQRDGQRHKPGDDD
jgi:hypothetical protein